MAKLCCSFVTKQYKDNAYMFVLQSRFFKVMDWYSENIQIWTYPEFLGCCRETDDTALNQSHNGKVASQALYPLV